MTPGSSGTTRTLPRIGIAVALALSWAVAQWVFGAGWEAAANAVGFAVLTVIAFVNHRTMLVPDRLSGAGTLLTVTAFFVAAVLLRAGTELLRAFEGGLVMFAVYLLVNLFSPKGMGMGCVKFAFVVGFIPASRAGVWYSSV